ncbi:MAG: TIGR00282 family metallophosphoesterase [Clostridia bacterium]|nr:TIGR00282 family metallophosphoesterase [Clostridia bacterium]
MTKGEAKILVLGDICGNAGTGAIESQLWGIRKHYGVDMVVANGENSTEDSVGLDKTSAQRLFDSGVDVITSGNHIWRKSSAHSLLENNPYVIRPANYPSACPGSGYCIFDMNSYKVLVMNVMGTVFMENLDSPFTTADKILQREQGNFDFAVCDIHAEATSEKIALARYLDGRVTIVFGTHTHVQTADEKVLSGGTGFITDAGMCGASDSVLGIKSEIIIQKFLTKMPARHEEAVGDIMINGCLFTVSTETGKCLSAERICIL